MSIPIQNGSADQSTVTLLSPGEQIRLTTNSSLYLGVVAAVDERGIRLTEMAQLFVESNASRPMPGDFVFPWAEVRGVAIPEPSPADPA